ncbi:MAG TPA: hypothetical protein VIK33_15680 [Anaerolineae bacterium]
MTRVRRARTIPLIITALIIGGCAGQGEQVATPTHLPATPVPATPTLGPTDVPATAASTSVSSPQATEQPTVVSCEPTPPDQLGPFYVPGAPERSSVGQGHVLSGVVRSSAGCSPIAGAQIEFWLAGSNGQYDDDHRATLFADAFGAYRFESNFPPPYSGRPSHIHIRVSANGYETLVTQYYPTDNQAEGTFDLVIAPLN